MKTDRNIIITVANYLSMVFRPSYYPLIGFFILFTMTYLTLLPWYFKVWVLCMVYVFTMGLPALGIYIYRRMHHWTAVELRHQHKRMVPYAIYIICYHVCLYLLRGLHLPNFVGAIIVISLLIQILCTIINMWWKISMHSAGSGAIIGGLVAYSALFQFNPIWWLCLLILINGAVNSSRMVLRQHSLWQVMAGSLLGFACGLLGILIM